jgi:hypothetical protein
VRWIAFTVINNVVLNVCVPIPYIVHSFSSELYGPWSKVVHYTYTQ